MEAPIEELLDKEQVCVLSVALPDGTPHSAVVHFSHESEPLRFFIQTTPTVKTKAIEEQGGSAKASMVVGLNEKDFVTLQMRGNVRIVTDAGELAHVYECHYRKHPTAEKYKGPDTIFLEFVPSWSRYTDMKTHPRTVIEHT